ncbi:hypothetical protein CVS40_4478 [Lucilia cuprina]|nr:hypothetical protein CVS40_4478 [Lucilia cuprina]
MLSLIYIQFTILVFNQSLYVLINAQQDLNVKPSGWNKPTNQLPSKNDHLTIDNYSHQKAPFSSYYNYNQLNAVPILNSYYESIIPKTIQPGKSNSYLNNKSNWEDIREGRSDPIKPPVELHHGYRYITPAISFPNIAHLKNVLYNDLGLEKNPNNFPSSPHGFEVRQTEKEIQNKIYFGTQTPSGETKILTHQTNIRDHKNNQNTTILRPVKNVTFTFYHNQPNMFDHKQFTHENNKNQSTNETSSKYIEDHNSVFNIKTVPSAQLIEHMKAENKTPETSFYSNNSSQENISSYFSKYSVMHGGVEATTDSSNVQPSQNELTLNITPSKKLFEHIQPGRVFDDIVPSHVSEVNNNKIFKYDSFKKPSANEFFSNMQTVESPPLMPANTSFSGLSIKKPDIQTMHIDGALAQEGGNNPIHLSEYEQHFANSQKHHIPKQNLPDFSGLRNEQSLHNISQQPAFAQESSNNSIHLSEYQQHFANSQKQHVSIQSLPHTNGLSIEQSSPKPANRYTPLDKYPSGVNQQYTFINTGLSSNVQNNDLHFQQLGTPSIQHQQNEFFSLDKNFSKPPNQYTSLDKYQSGEQSGVSSNTKNNLNFQHLGNLFIQNQINKDLSLHSTTDSKRQNQIIFPTNILLIAPTNFVTRVPTYSSLKTHDAVNLNIQKEYPTYNHHTPSFNIQEQNNTLKISGGNDINPVYPVSHLQPNKIVNQNMTDTNRLPHLYSFIAEQRPSVAFNNEYINPRTANYQTETTNYTPSKAQIVFNTANKYNPAQQNVQPKTPIVFPTMANKKIRSPHLVYGSPF